MFKKIAYIKNYSRFSSFQCNQNDGFGNFCKNTIIYAQNGSGKTSLSVMFRSMKGNNALISKKRTFHASTNPEILLICDDGKEQKFSKGRWNRKIQNIDIFDSFYMDDNIYIITIDEDPEVLNFFELTIKDEIEPILARWKELKKESIKLTNFKRSLKWKIKNEKDNGLYKLRMKEVIARKEEITKEISEIEDRRIEAANKQREVFLDKINYYLSSFTDDIQLTKLTQVSKRIIYGIKIRDQLLRTKEESIYSLKYSLSEGDKNALSLSFFLAKLDIIPKLDEYLIIVDDPFTSFDMHRKQTTINNLVRLSKKTQQMIILTHDIYFAKDIFSKIENDKCILQIVNQKSCSNIQLFDIEKATMTGISKDIFVLRNFLENGSGNDIELREVVRCIRPVIEGIFRIKYSDIVKDSQWLGDFLRLIRESIQTSDLYKLKCVYEELSEINDYSKIYHHSNPKYLEETINPKELELFVKRTLNVIKVI